MEEAAEPEGGKVCIRKNRKSGDCMKNGWSRNWFLFIANLKNWLLFLKIKWNKRAHIKSFKKNPSYRKCLVKIDESECDE